MKLLAWPTASLVVGLLAFPVVFATGDAPLTRCGWSGGASEAVLATIRTLESGGDYRAHAAGSTASGAYQFIDSTWAGYGGYARAVDAPPHVQDAKAADMVASILERHGGDLAAVPVVWYLGHLPPERSSAWDTVPVPEAGNTLTPRQYQTRWLTTYDELAAAPTTALTATRRDQPPAPCGPGGGIAPLGGDWAYPAPPALFASAPVDDPHHTYPAWDWMLPTGTPIYAVRGGTVTTVQHWPHNWWDAGCGTAAERCSTCGIGVTITDTDGSRWAYCHGSAVHVATGQTVSAGAQLLSSGNTGRSSGPHLHLQIRSADGQLRCPQPILRSLRDGQTGIDPADLPVSGCFF